MSLLAAFRKTKTSTVDRAAAQLARGDQVDVSALTEADVAAVEDRAAELRRLAELQPVAAQVDKLRTKKHEADEAYQKANATWLAAARDAANKRFRIATPEQPSPEPRRRVKAQMAEAEDALRQVVALVPDSVAADWVAADRAAALVQSEANQAARRERDVNAARARLQHRHDMTTDGRRKGELREEMAALPTEAELSKATKAAEKPVKPAATARTKALKALCSWSPD